MKKKQINNYAFIDSQNVNLGVKQGHGWQLDFARFRVYLKDKFHVSKAFLFIGNVQGNEGLYLNLQKAGYILILKPTLEYKKAGKIHIKGNVDAELVLHTMIEYDNFDQAVIATGDGDFYCLVQHLKNHDKLKNIIIPNKRQHSALLRQFREYFIYLGELKKKLEYKKERE